MDSEGGAPVAITANRAALAEYRANVEAHLAALESACVTGGGRYARVLCDEPLETVATNVFRRMGWWR